MLLSFFQDLLAPKHCLIEEIKFSGDGYISQQAIDKLPLAKSSFSLTGTKRSESSDFCLDYLYGLIEAQEESKYLNPIYEMKYMNLKEVGIQLGKLLANKFTLEMIERPDVVIPIPIHNAKKRERGFNQSDIIAASLANELKIEYDDQFMKRDLYTATQTKLNRTQRLKNISNAFSVISNNQYNNVLLIDDVYTTGATINQAAKCIKEVLNCKVSAATVVIA